MAKNRERVIAEKSCKRTEEKVKLTKLMAKYEEQIGKTFKKLDEDKIVEVEIELPDNVWVVLYKMAIKENKDINIVINEILKSFTLINNK